MNKGKTGRRQGNTRNRPQNQKKDTLQAGQKLKTETAKPIEKPKPDNPNGCFGL